MSDERRPGESRRAWEARLHRDALVHGVLTFAAIMFITLGGWGLMLRCSVGP